ncbi:MAG: threonine synthase [Candidatus Heimdallarchaeota archaeon]|nr:threonine synthase [Candidatus Heimdallarchaeota archaeon]
MVIKIPEPENFLLNLKCSYCGKTYDANKIHTVCESCGKVLFPQYDLEKAKESLDKIAIEKRKRYNIWRLFEIMPVNDEKYRISLGEGWTPIIKTKNYGHKIGLKNLFIKDEGQNPTGTFKSRGLCAAVAKALELGLTDFVMPSAGNAGAAIAAYSAYAGAKAHIFVPTDTPDFIKKEIEVLGAELQLVDGLISDAGKKAKEAGLKNNWFSMATLKEPYRVEGKKTMGFELAEQFDWTLPEVIIYPTGGGTGIVGMWKAFDEMEKIGLIGSERPKMICVQPTGCQPMVRAFHSGEEFAKPWEDAHSFAAGIRVPGAVGDYLILNAIRESKGTAIAVDDEEIKDAMYDFAKLEGIMVAPEAAATVAAVIKLTESGFLDPEQKIILFITGSGLTTPSDW